MKPDIQTLHAIRKEIYGKLIKELQASAYEFQEDAETWKARMHGQRLRSVYDPEEQACKSAFAASVYGEISELLKRALEV